MPENEEATPATEAQQEVAQASDELSCRTRLMGPLFMLGALVAVVQATPAIAQSRLPSASRQQRARERDRQVAGPCPGLIGPARAKCMALYTPPPGTR
jgi:hypothetical protein